MKLTPTKIIHYGLLLVAAYIVYSWLTKGGGRDSYDNHPRNREKFKDTEDEGEGQGHKYANDARHVKVDNEETGQKSKDRGKLDRGKQRSEDTNRNNVKKKESEEDLGFLEEDIQVVEIDQKDVEKEEVNIEVKDEEEVNFAEKVEEIKDEQEIKLKLKKKDDDGVDVLKEINDADFRNDPDVEAQINHKLEDHHIVKIPKLQREWHEEHDNIDLAEEKKKRRVLFFKRVKEFEIEDIQEKEDIHIYESHDDFPFVTASYSAIFDATLAFINSVQFNYPQSVIGIFNIGLSADEISFLETLCNVEVVQNFLPIFPAYMSENMAKKLWRPAILQVALSKYVHFVYLDPKRFLKKAVNLRGHFALSRKGGAAMFGKLKSYSTAVVTNPEMYYYLAINVRKLLRLQHVELNMLIMHNSKHLQQYFTRWFMNCAREEYCMAPPGSKRTCNENMYPKSHKYADCHRYDESALNILLASWHNYDFDHYAAADFVTQYYDGRDVRRHLKVCHAEKRKQREL